MNQLLVIDGVSVRQYPEGSFCLNDLQKAAVFAAGEARSPRSMEVYEFMRRPETQALVELLEKETTGNPRIKPVVTTTGRNGGTFVCKELVYAYAMWISPAFHLKVIRTFDAIVTGHGNAQRSDQVQAGVILLESAARMLNFSNSSKLGAYQKLQEFAGLPNMMPVYAIDAPSDAVDGSSRATTSLTTLLRDHKTAISTADAYIRLEQLGLVQRMSRPSNGKQAVNGIKGFWMVTNRGLLFAKNVTNPKSPRETQPHFFTSKSAELIRMMLTVDQEEK